MKRRTVVGSVGAAALGVVGVSAYTSASVDRAAALTVNDDDASVLELVPGVGASLNSGTLELDGDTERLNREATFEFGDISDPSANPAFRLINNDDQSQDISINLSKSSTAGHTLTIKATNDGGSTVQDITTGTGQTYSVPSGAAVDFAFELVTTTSNSDYSGLLELDATPTP